MMFRLSALAAVAGLLAAPAHAVSVTQWNFNSATPDANTGTGSTAPALGTGQVLLAGGATATFASGDEIGRAHV